MRKTSQIRFFQRIWNEERGKIVLEPWKQPQRFSSILAREKKNIALGWDWREFILEKLNMGEFFLFYNETEPGLRS